VDGVRLSPQLSARFTTIRDCRLKIFLCNEVVRELEFHQQCRFAREVGYSGLEIAPFTLAAEPGLLSSRDARELRFVADGEGVEIGGLHWLLAAPQGLSITTSDPAISARTREVGTRLVDLCAELGGRYLVHGSPMQRRLETGSEGEGRRNAMEYFAAMADAASAAKVGYYVEPLARTDTAFITSVEEAIDIVEEIGSGSLATMIDCCAAASNGDDLPALLRRWLPSGLIRHLHLNDPNRRGPGEGALGFGPILDVLSELHFAGTTAVEPFVYLPDGPSCAARSIGYLNGLMESHRGPS
jgi:sugar phosphate isomerase/epimerase